MSNHTPGPWEVNTLAGRPNREVFADVLICDCGIGQARIMDTEEIEANARLIAAAPDLLDVVKQYLEWGAMTGSDRDLFYYKFTKAVAKAEGL